MKYHFSLTNERGHVSRFLFPTFRAAYPRAVEHGADLVYTDREGTEHIAEPLAGEEYPGLAA